MDGRRVQEVDAVCVPVENQRQLGAAEDEGVDAVPLDHPIHYGKKDFPRLFPDDPQLDLGKELLMDDALSCNVFTTVAAMAWLKLPRSGWPRITDICKFAIPPCYLIPIPLKNV